ncbi:MAG: CYTH domain-containing protein [Selenomonas sp.]|nr:CYTH domain-containing protein [Selenomonas sp.]
MEIERQFLVAAVPVLPAEYEVLRQGYVSLEPEIRIRQIGEKHFVLTVKRGAGLVREEWETEITPQEFANLSQRLWPATLMIEKRRYIIALADGNQAELHMHEGNLTGFNYVEVEFPSIEAAHYFVPPEWFGREVTEDERFSYGTLAQVNGMELVKEMVKM